MKYKDWLYEWLDFHVRTVVKERTYEKYRQQTFSYIVPPLGEFEMEELSPAALQKFVAGLSAKGLASNTVNGIISLLKSSLRRAAALGAARTQFSDAVVRPKRREKKVECFTGDEQRKLENYILNGGHPRLYGIFFCLYTGLRLGELLALKWKDIDFARGTVKVCKSCRDSWKDGRYVKISDTTKTESSGRVIPVPKQLMPHLKRLKKLSHGEYFVSGRSEYGAEVRVYQRMFENLLKKLGIAKKSFHALRHTFATRALEVGMDVKTLSELLGHSNPTVTLNRYAHSMLGHKIDMMNRLGKILS